MLAAGGGAGQQLQEVEGAALAGEQGPRRPLEFEQHLVRGDPVTIRHLPADGHLRIQDAEHLVDPGAACHDRRFSGDDARPGVLLGGNQARREIATANVFAQGCGDVFSDDLGKIGQGSAGH